ncbi:MAG: hypothetical protein IJU64_01615 [Bacilli bacterium]|nr:hypothetical protein [Bacilli bacterium]
MARFKNKARLLVPAALLLVGGLLLSTPSLTSASAAYETLTQNIKVLPASPENENRGSAVPDALVTTLGEIYDDKTRAQEDLEALYAAGIIDSNGKLTGLDLREDGKSVGLSELTKRIANGEKVGDITVNGKPATAEQVMKISQVNTAIEIAELLESDIDVTDDHAKNLEALLRAIQNGSVDLQKALKTGTLQLSGDTANDSDTQDDIDYSLPGTIPSKLSFSQDGQYYYAPYVSGSTYQRNYPFFHPFHDPAYDDYFNGFENAMPGAGEVGGVSPNSARDMFDWSKAIIGIDDNRVTPTVTAVLPLKSDDFVQNIIATDGQNNRLTDISKNGIGLEMELPTYGKVNLKYYFNYMFFQYDGDARDFYGNNVLQPGGNREDHGCIRMPVYLVEDESTGRFVAVATRYMAPTTTSGIPHLNTLRLYVDPRGNSAVYSSTEYPKPYIASWEDSYVDDLGNHYWDMVNYANREGLVAAEGDYTKKIVIPGRCLWYFVPPLISLTTELYKTRPEGSWTQAKHGFIKLENPENPDFPYVYPNDLDHPERQHDAELMVTEQLYESYAQAEAKDDSWVAPIYLGDNDLRIAIRISDRWDFSRAPDGQMLQRIRWVDDSYHGYEDLTPEDFTVETTCNDGLYILTITPKKVTSPDRYLDHSNRAMLGIMPYALGNYYLGIPIHMRVCEADPFLSVPKSSQIRQTTEGLKLCSELYERHVLGYNDSEVTLRYDDCNPFGLLAGDFGEISNEPNQHAGSKTVFSEFNSLGQLFDGFLGQFDLPSDGTEFVPSLDDEDLNRYNAFYEKAMEIYDRYSLASFAKNANHDLSQSALIGLSHPYTMTFGNNANVDFQAVIAKLFGFASKTEFQNYAKVLGEYTKTKGLSGAIADGTFPSDNVRAIYPIAIKNNHASPVLAYVFVDNSFHVSIWVNDIDAALWAINFDADHYSNTVVNNDFYCRNALFGTGVGGVEITFSSNLAQHNKIDTLYVAQLYKVSGIDRSNLNTLPANAQRIDIEGWGQIPASASDLVSHIVVPSTAFDGPGAYAVTISADYNDGTTTQTFSVIVYIEVKSAPLKIHFEKLAGNYFDKDNIPEIKYNVTSAVESAQIKYTIQGSGDEISEMKDAANGVIPFTPDDFDGLKKAYTITVYAKNYEEQPWSVDSMMVTIYNKDVLELLIKDVAFGEVGGSTGGQAGDGTEKADSSIEIDNNPKIVDLLDKEGDGKGITISGYDLNALRNDINLQRIISINYGSSVLGTISDRLQWLVKEANGQNSSAIALYNKEGGAYVALKSYASYIPTTDFLIVATDDRGEDAPVTITATHASSGSTRSVEVTVKTLEDKLYLFRFLPKAKTYVHYFNGKGVERELYSNEQGELAIYEPDGIASDIDTLSHVGQETYAGTIRNKDLVSGEKDVALLQTYPCNNLTLEPISNQTITFLLPDGKPYSGSATLRAGIYKKGVYCPDYGVRTTDKTDTPQILRDDIHVTVKDGKTTLYYDPTQLAADWGLYFGIRYVYEYRVDGYQPGYAIIDPFSENPADFIINLQKVKGKASDPQITRQVYQQYLNGTTKTSYSRNVIDSTVNIGLC